MNWLQKTSRTKYIDTQVFDKPGAPKWSDKINEINQHKNALRAEAEKICEHNGHYLAPWTLMNNTQCRRCGASISLHTVHGKVNSDPMSGAAMTNKCHVKFDNELFSELDINRYNNEQVI